jgi:hypothetical protein
MIGRRRHCQDTAKSVVQTSKMLEEAEQSNECARMRGAIGQARKALVEMKDHMDKRMNVMDMVEKSHARGQK